MHAIRRQPVPEGHRAQALTADLLKSRPLLRAVEDANDENHVAMHRVDDQIRQRSKNKFARLLLLSRTAPVREFQQQGRRIVEGAHQFRRPVRHVLEQIVGDALGIGRSFPCPAELHSGAGPRFGQASFEACTDLFMREHVSTLDLSEALFNFTQKPIVVLDRPLDGLQHECFRSHAAAVGRACELGFEVGRHVQLHASQCKIGRAHV